MAKGEGGEQYSNASLLNKPVSEDGIKLARKVSFIHELNNKFKMIIDCSNWSQSEEPEAGG